MTRSKNELLRECERVNQLLKKEAERQGLGTRKSLARMEEARQNDKVAFSFWAQLEFQEYIRRELESHPTISASLLINKGARLLKLSPVTTKRYLAVLRSDDGPFSSFGDAVMINQNYTEIEDYGQDSPTEPAESETV